MPASTILTKAKKRIGALSERVNDPTLAASDADDALLEMYLEDALVEVATRTDRLTDSETLSLSQGTATKPKPPYLDKILEAAIYDGDRYELKLVEGSTLASASKNPDAETGRPEKVGAHGGSLYFWPVPSKAYDVELEIGLNGSVGATKTIDAVVDAAPSELNRALVAFVVREYFDFHGEPGLSDQAGQRYERGVRQHKGDPLAQKTATRHYNPLGF